MKKYINSEGRKAHFISAVPEGWREMTDEEIAAEETERQVKAQEIKKEKQLQILKDKKLEDLIFNDPETPQEIKDYIGKKKEKN
jgi:hypothetical protein